MNDKEILEFIKENKKEVLEALSIKKEIKMLKKLRKLGIVRNQKRRKKIIFY